MNDTYQAMLREVAHQIENRDDVRPGEATARQMMEKLAPEMSYRQFVYMLDCMVEKGRLESRIASVQGHMTKLYRYPDEEVEEDLP